MIKFLFEGDGSNVFVILVFLLKLRNTLWRLLLFILLLVLMVFVVVMVVFYLVF